MTTNILASTPSFICFQAESDGLLWDDSKGAFPLRLFGWSSAGFFAENRNRGGTLFLFGISRHACIDTGQNEFPLREHMYAMIQDDTLCVRPGKRSIGIVIQHLGYKGFFMLGGPIEDEGRLRYIDGCTDTLLISPLRKGDPCLNALYFPKGVTQQSHTHPSVRIATVAAGSGECVTPHGTHPLEPGMILIVPANAVHAFNTPAKPMTIITFHPDSDFGPEDKNHPVINRTLIEGVSAAKLER